MAVSIPGKLVADLTHRRCALLVGPGVLAPEVDPYRRIRRDLALCFDACSALRCPHQIRRGECALPEGCIQPFREVTAWAAGEAGPAQLQRAVAAQLAALPNPDALHESLAELDVPVILTTRQDEVIESALAKLGRPFVRFVRNEDLAFWEQHKTVVVKLFGTASQPESLVLTSVEERRFLRDSRTISSFVLASLAQNTLLLVGFSLKEDTEILEQLYDDLIDSQRAGTRPGYAVVRDADEATRRRWAARNVRLLKTSLPGFLRDLVRRVGRIEVSCPATAEPALPEAPYKFLDYFDGGDRGIYFGRDAEVAIMAWNTLAKRLSIVYGPSGVGKTSLLRAGVVPRLEQRGYTCLVTRVSRDPVRALRQALLPRGPAKGPLATTLRRAWPADTRVICIFDQFEEIFLSVDPTTRRLFVEQLASCLEQRDLDLRFVLAVREEYLGHFDETWSRAIPGVLEQRFRLLALDGAHARLVITEPAAKFGLGFAEELTEHIVRDLAVATDGRCEPAQVQIVCSCLYEDLRRHGESDFTLDLYHRLGGAARILAEYLEDTLGSLTSAGPYEVRLILKSLVTPAGTKASLQAEEIAGDDDVRRAGLPAAKVDTILAELQGRRLVRFVGESRTFELTHDILAEKVAQWITAAELLRKRLRETLRTKAVAFAAFGVHLSAEDLDLYKERGNGLLLADEDLLLLCRSALFRDHDTIFWLDAARTRTLVPRLGREILHTFTQSEDPEVSGLELLRLARDPEWMDYVVERLVSLEETGAATEQHRALALLAKLDASRAVAHLAHLAPSGYAVVPAGSFTMGSDVFSNEEPVHDVWLDTFFIKKTQVTFREFQAFLKADTAKDRQHWTTAGWQWLQRREDDPKIWSDRRFGGAEQPAVGVTWYEAMAYCRWLGTATGLEMTLPSEAEFEKAARGAHGNVYPWGGVEPDPLRCNIRSSGIGHTLPVGSFSPEGDSPYGVADVSGNAWDWTRSLYAPYSYDPDDGREDPEGRGVRAVRGGSWAFDHFERCARRDLHSPENQPSIGSFRPVIRLPSLFTYPPRSAESPRQRRVLELRNEICWIATTEKSEWIDDLDRTLIELEGVATDDRNWVLFLGGLRALLTRPRDRDPVPLGGLYREALDAAERTLLIRLHRPVFLNEAEQDTLGYVASALAIIAVNLLRFEGPDGARTLLEPIADLETALTAEADRPEALFVGWLQSVLLGNEELSPEAQLPPNLATFRERIRSLLVEGSASK